MSAVAKTSKYTYRSSGGGTTDVNIEYSADLSALSRLEVPAARLVCGSVCEVFSDMIQYVVFFRTRSVSSKMIWNPKGSYVRG